VRNAKDENGRFRYLFKGVGNGFAMFGNWERAGTVAIVEGEVNAASYALAMPNHFVIAIPGASKGLTEQLANLINESGKLIVLFFDNDSAGRDGLEKVKRQLIFVGVEPIRIIIPKENPIKDKDLNDILKERGPDGLRSHIKKNLDDGEQVKKRARKSGKALAKFMDVQDVRSAALSVGYKSHKPFVRFHTDHPNRNAAAAMGVIVGIAEKRRHMQAIARAYSNDPIFSAIINLSASAAMEEKARPHDTRVLRERLGASYEKPGYYNLSEYGLGFLTIAGNYPSVDFEKLKEWVYSYLGIREHEEGKKTWFTTFLAELAKAKARYTEELIRFFRFIGRTFNGRPLPGSEPAYVPATPAPAFAVAT